MGSALIERRRERRLPASSLRIERATLRPGCPVDVLDLSVSGAQVTSERPLRPGSRIHVRLDARNCMLAVAAQVVRCEVWEVTPESVTYRGGLQFEEECRPFWEEQARSGYALAIGTS